MGNSTGPCDMSKELAALQHERKNQNMKKLPANTTIQRRPLGHPAIPPPQAGPKVQKVVYVSCRTPVISAVKRVKKLLEHVEKRALQGVEAKNHQKARTPADLAELSDKLARNPEEILVKASGRAMEQALRVGEWFRAKESDFMCNVEVRTSSIAAIDDIVFTDAGDSAQDVSGNEVHEEGHSTKLEGLDDTTLEGGDTTLDILGGKPTSGLEKIVDESGAEAEAEAEQGNNALPSQDQHTGNRRRKRKKRKRATYENDEVPEARIRWVKTVEIAISLKA